MRRDHLTRFKPTTDKPLSRRTTGVRLPVDVEEALQVLPASERTAWLRKVIAEAVERELMNVSFEKATTPANVL